MNSLDPPTSPPPLFEEWSLESLQDQVQRYGFKVSKQRQPMINQLKAVYQALFQQNQLSSITTATNQQQPPPPPPPIPNSNPSLIPFASRLFQTIQSDHDLWSRILRYEPIAFDEFISIATRIGIPMHSQKSKQQLQSWLDLQSICFYTND